MYFLSMIKCLNFLKQKHSKSYKLNADIILRGEKPLVLGHFENIDEEMVEIEVMKTKGRAYTSGLDTDR